MSDRPIKGQQTQAISSYCPVVQTSFSLEQSDQLIIGQGVDYIHYKSVPSPLGLKDRGDYRKDNLDVITSNGNLYIKCGTFTACETDNSTNRHRMGGGVVDPSVSNLALPRFYNSSEIPAGSLNTAPQNDGKRIYLDVGDRIYIADLKANVLVSWGQKMTYEDGLNVPMFPICEMELPIVDSQNILYVQNVDFTITSHGDISWIPGGKRPGIDPATGLGRIFSVRYLYRAYHYVVQLPKEVRMTNVTENGVRSPERMPYNAVIQREYLYHNQNRGDKKTGPAQPREQAHPQDSIKPNKNIIVDMTGISDE